MIIILVGLFVYTLGGKFFYHYWENYMHDRFETCHGTTPEICNTTDIAGVQGGDCMWAALPLATFWPGSWAIVILCKVLSILFRQLGKIYSLAGRLGASLSRLGS